MIPWLFRDKLPELRPETMTMTGLNLLSQLGSMVRSSEGQNHQTMDQVFIHLPLSICMSICLYLSITIVC